MAGLFGDTEVSPLTLGLLQAGSALMSGDRRGLAQAPMAFAGGLLQGQEAQRARQAQMLREQMLREQMGMQREQLGIQREDAGIRRQRAEIELRQVRAVEAARIAEQERIARVGEWIRQNRPDLEPAFNLNPTAVAQQLLPKERAPIKLAPGDRLYEPETFRELAAAPEKPPAPSDIARLMTEMNALPQGDPRRKMYENALRKATTHAPAANQTVYTGTMVPVEGPDGRPRFVMPGKDGTATEIPGLSPPGTAAADRAQANAQATALQTAARMRQAVNEALSKINKFSTGGVGSVMSALPATDATDLRALIDTLQANLSFSELQKMREASPTGGALGATSEREIILLGSTVASLDARQSPEQLRANLRKVDQQFERVQNLIRQGQRGAQGAANAPANLQEQALRELERRGR